MSSPTSQNEEGLQGAKSDEVSVPGDLTDKVMKEDEEKSENEITDEVLSMINETSEPLHDIQVDVKVAQSSENGTEANDKMKNENGQGETKTNGVAKLEDISKPDKSPKTQHGHKLRKCSVPLKDISLCRDPILKDLYQSAIKRMKAPSPPPKPKNTLYPDFSPKEIPLPLLFPGLPAPVAPPPAKTSARGKRVNNGKRGKQNAYLAPKQPFYIPPSLPSNMTYAEPIFKPAYLTHAERLMNSSYGPFGRVNAAELVSLCKELADAREVIEDLRAKLTNAIMHDSGREEPQGNVMNLVELPEPKLNKTESMVAPTGYRIIDMQLMSLALDASQRCDHDDPGRKIQIYEMHSANYQEHLSKSFAFVCSICKKATVFPNSSFSKEWPPNFSVNKQFLQILGAKSYHRMVNFVRKVDKPSPLLPRFSSDPAQLVLSIDQKTYKTNPVPQSPPFRSHSTYSPPMPLPRPTISNGQPARGRPPKTKTPTKIRASPLLPVGSRISVLPPGTQISGHVDYTTTQETGLKPGVYRVNKTGCSERIIVVRQEESQGSDGCIDLDSDSGPSSSFNDPSFNNVQDPIANSSSMGSLEDFYDDDPPDFSHFLDVSLGAGDNNLMGTDSLMDPNSNNSFDHSEPSSKENEDKSLQYMGWQDDDERINEDSLVDPLQPEVSLGGGDYFDDDDDDSDDDIWEGPARKRSRKRKSNQSRTNKAKRPKNNVPEEIILS